MKTKEILKTVVWSASVLALTGCLHIDLGIGRPTNRSRPVDKIIIVPDPDTDPGTIAEIDAAMKLSFDDSKTAALKAIALRKNLSPAAQVHLVNSSMQGLSFADSRLEVMKTLAANPAFCVPAKQTMLAQIDRLDFEGYKRDLLAAINQAAITNPPPAQTEKERDQPVPKEPAAKLEQH